MLDLNIDAIYVHSFSDESSDHLKKSLTAMEKLTEDGAGPQREDSGTSISSVINADETPASTRGDNGSGSTFNVNRSFGQPEWATRVENSVRSTELVTRQLFPVNRRVKNYEFGSICSLATSLLRPQLLNLTPPDDQLMDQINPPLPWPQVRKSRRGPKSRSSEYRGVTFYRRTGRWESHIWDCGEQVYLGGFDTAYAAARAYDRAAVKFRGVDADINFSISDYEDDLIQMKDLAKEEFVLILHRQSTGICRGNTKYRGVTLHQCGRWEARMDQFLVKKAFDKAAIECIGEEAMTNFDPSTYEGEVSLVNNNHDRCHNLDLNLWISPPGDQKGNNNVRSLHLHDAAYGLPRVKRTKSLVSAPMTGETPYALTMASIHLPSLSGIYSGLAPNSEERVIKTTEAVAVPSPGFSKWAWQMNSHGIVNPMAASSGFSSTTVAPVFSGSLLPLNTDNSRNSYLSSPSNETSFYSSHKY